MITLVVTIVLGIVAALAVAVTIYVYTTSSVGKEASDLQDKANTAQSQIIEALQIQVASDSQTIGELKQTCEHQAEQIALLHELVTQAAKVDELRTALADYQRTVEGLFNEVDGKLDEFIDRFTTNGGDTHD